MPYSGRSRYQRLQQRKTQRAAAEKLGPEASGYQLESEIATEVRGVLELIGYHVSSTQQTSRESGRLPRSRGDVGAGGGGRDVARLLKRAGPRTRW